MVFRIQAPSEIYLGRGLLTKTLLLSFIYLNCSTIKCQSQSAENNFPHNSPRFHPSSCIIFSSYKRIQCPEKKSKLLVFCTTQNVEKGRYFANCFYGENRISEV